MQRKPLKPCSEAVVIFVGDQVSKRVEIAVRNQGASIKGGRISSHKAQYNDRSVAMTKYSCGRISEFDIKQRGKIAFFLENFDVKDQDSQALEELKALGWRILKNQLCADIIRG